MEHHLTHGAHGLIATNAGLQQVTTAVSSLPSSVPHIMHHHHQVGAQTPVPSVQEEHHVTGVITPHPQLQHQPPTPQPQHHQQIPQQPHVGGGRGRVQVNQQHFCLRWNNFQMNITSVFEHLLRSETFVDVTLACDGSQIKAHKMVLSACSPYFQQLLSQNPCKHPIIILPAEVRFSEMKSIIDFVYRGEIDVAQEQLPDLLKVADALQIKGLCEVQEKGGVTSVRGRNRQMQSYRPALRHSRLNHPFKYRRRHLETLSRRGLGRGGVRGVGNSSNRSVPNSGMGNVDSIKSEHGMNELVVKKENVGTQVLLHGPVGNLSMGQGLAGQQQHQQGHHHQDGTGPESQYFVLKPVGQHGLPSSHQQMDMLSPASMSGMQQNADNMVMMMAAAAAAGAGDGSEHPDYGQQHQYQQQQVTYQTATTPVSMGYPMTATPQPMQSGMSDAQLAQHHHHGAHLQHHSVMKDEAPESDNAQFAVAPELLGLVPTSGGSMSHAASQASEEMMTSPTPSQHTTGSVGGSGGASGGSGAMKNWTEQDLEQALDALRQKTMSLTRASAHFGIPSTTLWQRAHRAGVDIPRHMSPMKTWTDDDLRLALEAMRAGTLSAHRASKEFNIPSSTLYKIAKKEGIKLAQPFNSTPPSWSRDDLRRAFDAIKSGMSVTKASTEFGIPSGTLYGKCRREGIELRGSKESANWSEEDLVDALEAVRVGEMSINQASLHFNVPYSTLYNRFRKCAMAEEEEEDQHNKALAAAQVAAMGADGVGQMVVGPNGCLESGPSTSVVEVHQPMEVSGPDGSLDMNSQGGSSSAAGELDSRRGSPSELQHYDGYQQQQSGESIPMTPVPQS